MQATKPVKKPGKQRKLFYNAPAHLRHKFMAAPLSPELIASKGVKTLPARKGDTVRILRGDHKGFEGKISQVDLKNYKIYVEGLTREKVDGTTIFVPVHPSKVMIRNLNLDDKWRKAIVERKKELAKKVKEAEKKPPKKAVEEKKEKPVKKKATVVQEKPPEKKPKARRKRARKKSVAKKKTEKKAAEKAKPAEKEEKPKAAKKTRAKRKTATKTEGGT